MTIDLERSECLSEISEIPLVSSTDESSSDGELDSSKDQANDPPTTSSPRLGANFPRSPEPSFPSRAA